MLLILKCVDEKQKRMQHNTQDAAKQKPHKTSRRQCLFTRILFLFKAKQLTFIQLTLTRTMYAAKGLHATIHNVRIIKREMICKT